MTYFLKKLSLIGLIALTCLLSGCKKSHYAIKITCPKPPVELPVKVRNGIISGKDLDAVINNHTLLWQYIHILQKLGCTMQKVH